jgi:hypothetical protein
MGTIVFPCREVTSAPHTNEWFFEYFEDLLVSDWGINITDMPLLFSDK